MGVISWLWGNKDEILLYYSGNYPAIGTYWYSDRYPRPFGIYRVTSLKEDNRAIDKATKEVWGVLVLKITLASCIGLKVVEQLNNPTCACDAPLPHKKYHNEPFEKDLYD